MILPAQRSPSAPVASPLIRMAHPTLTVWGSQNAIEGRSLVLVPHRATQAPGTRAPTLTSATLTRGASGLPLAMLTRAIRWTRDTEVSRSHGCAVTGVYYPSVRLDSVS